MFGPESFALSKVAHYTALATHARIKFKKLNLPVKYTPLSGRSEREVRIRYLRVLQNLLIASNSWNTFLALISLRNQFNIMFYKCYCYL